MRKREYISPTAIKSYISDTDGFYLKYLTEEKFERDPQTQPMSVGSAFDAYCKSRLHSELFGKGNDPRFEFDSIFTEMVEEQNRDWAHEAGKHVFEAYVASGAFRDLLFELANNSLDAPRMEFELRGSVDGTKSGLFGEVVLLGKPDLSWQTKDGFNVIFDWKVNGYCSKSGVSPKQGYLKLRDPASSLTNYANTQHKATKLGRLHGYPISVDHPMEKVDEDWAAQLSVYGWLLGMPIGSEFLTFIDQVVCRPGDVRPVLRFAEHRTYVTPDFQKKTFEDAVLVWDVCNNGHVFRDMTPEASKAREEMLDIRAKAIAELSVEDQMLRQVTQRNSW